MKRNTLRLLDLPSELVEEILSKAPATSKDPEFIKKHLDKAAKQYLVLKLTDSRISRVNLHGIYSNIVDPTTMFKGGLRLTDLHQISEQVVISKVFHCDGLLLCTTGDDRLVVWNPCNGQTKWIQPGNCKQRQNYSRVALGYENNKSCHSYKILRCWGIFFDLSEDIQPVRFEIYELSSDSWRVLEEVLVDCVILKTGVSLKGNSYLLVLDNTNRSIFLVSFDFTTEKLRRLCLSFSSRYVDTLALSVVREEQLSVLHQRQRKVEIEIWVTTSDKTDHTKVLSWRKFLLEKKVAVWFDARDEDETFRNIVCIIREDTEYREIPFGDSLPPFIFSYVPSLAQIQQ
ncbi:hypothetical protein EUTSA_v10002999mg, partial [Eutrema salsugineum]